MGDIYQANDTQLRRSVVIKVLRKDFEHSKEHTERFEREAHALSQLSHPNICVVHGFGEQDGFRYIVLEHIEGEPLDDVLSRGRLPVARVVSIATQIAAALAAAHKRGIIHRDLKPSNVMLTPHGVKLIDFGIASLQPPSVIDATTTGHTPLTAEGALLGTFQYMSPEQIEGKRLDPRSDIFSFGTLLYEMLSGTRAFNAPSQASLFACILHDQPPPLALHAPTVSPQLQAILDTCLAKDPDDRWQSIRDVELQLKAPIITPAATAIEIAPEQRSRMRWLPYAALLLLPIFAFALGWILHRPAAQSRTLRVSVNPPEDWYFDPYSIALSPDGTRIAFAAFSKDGQQRLWLRNLSSSLPQQFEGTDDASYPFWSADGRRIGFFAQGKLRAVNTATGEVSIVADAPYGRGGAWNRDDLIIYAPALAGPLMKVSASGGVPEPATKVPGDGPEGHRWPTFLPDGKHFLFFRDWVRPGASNPDGLYLAATDGSSEKLISPAIAGKTAFADGKLFYYSARSLVAEDFDLRSMALGGNRTSVIQQELSQDPGFKNSAFSISNQADVVYPSSTDQNLRQLWFDHTGKQLGELPINGCMQANFSPDGNRLVVACDETGNGKQNVFLYDLKRNVTTRVTSSGDDSSPVFSADGKSIFFSSQLNTKLNVMPLDGTGVVRMLLTSSRITPSSVSPDGRYLIAMDHRNGPPQLTLYDLKEDRPSVFTAVGAEPQFSPDGKWVAYTGNSQSGKNQVFVKATAPGDTPLQVSSTDGAQPRWAPDSRHLYYIASDRKLMQVDFSAATFEPSAPQPLFTTPIYATRFVLAAYAVTPDGTRFLINSLPAAGAPVTLLIGSSTKKP